MRVTINFDARAIPWAGFVATHPPYSIALDGYVRGAPQFTRIASGPYRSFNHHEDVDRSCTAATCEQVRRAILLDLFECFRDAHGPRAMLWVNDGDEDVCLATWLLKSPHRAAEPLVRMMTQIEDLLDSSAGLSPMPHESETLAKLRWVFAPCFQVRLGRQAPLDTIAEVHRRIDLFVIGRADQAPLEGESEYLFTGERGWQMTTPRGSLAKAELVRRGCKAGVEVLPQGEGCWRYTLWRKSEYVEWFPVPQYLARLAHLESGWGGSTTVGGSPRGGHSRLPPKEVFRLINMWLLVGE